MSFLRISQRFILNVKIYAHFFQGLQIFGLKIYIIIIKHVKRFTIFGSQLYHNCTDFDEKLWNNFKFVYQNELDDVIVFGGSDIEHLYKTRD